MTVSKPYLSLEPLPDCSVSTGVDKTYATLNNWWNRNVTVLVQRSEIPAPIQNIISTVDSYDIVSSSQQEWNTKLYTICTNNHAALIEFSTKLNEVYEKHYRSMGCSLKERFSNLKGDVSAAQHIYTSHYRVLQFVMDNKQRPC